LLIERVSDAFTVAGYFCGMPRRLDAERSVAEATTAPLSESIRACA